MIEIRNTSDEPIVVQVSTYEGTVEVDPGKAVEIAEYEPGMSLRVYPKYDSNQPRRRRTAVREG